MDNLESRKSTIIGEITEDEARKMVAAYVAENPEKTKSVWFSLEQMDQIVTILKTEKMLDMGTDGLRIYFGNYTADTMAGLPNYLLGKTSVIFVSTKEVDAGGGITYHQDYFEHLNLHKMVSAPENRGEICQPNCKGTI